MSRSSSRSRDRSSSQRDDRTKLGAHFTSAGDIIREAYAAFGRGDIDGYFNLLSANNLRMCWQTTITRSS
jgi:hypothetical protein